MFVSSKKSALVGLAGFAMIALSAGSAHAQLTISGITSGTFSNVVSPNLVFNQAVPFTVTTVNGNASLGSANVAGDGSLGSFTASANPFTVAAGTTFNFIIDFTAPSGVSPDPRTFQAAVSGQVVNQTTGGFFIDFDNTANMFTFTGIPTPGLPGSFMFTLNDVAINPGETVALSGRITGANVIPEPGTMTLLGMGALGALGMVRRRRSAK